MLIYELFYQIMSIWIQGFNWSFKTIWHHSASGLSRLFLLHHTRCCLGCVSSVRAEMGEKGFFETWTLRLLVKRFILRNLRTLVIQVNFNCIILLCWKPGQILMIWLLIGDFLKSQFTVTWLLGRQETLGILELSLHSHAHVGAELCFLDYLLEQRRFLVVFVRTAEDLANLSQCQALLSTSLK